MWEICEIQLVPVNQTARGSILKFIARVRGPRGGFVVDESAAFQSVIPVPSREHLAAVTAHLALLVRLEDAGWRFQGHGLGWTDLYRRPLPPSPTLRERGPT